MKILKNPRNSSIRLVLYLYSRKGGILSIIIFTPKESYTRKGIRFLKTSITLAKEIEELTLKYI
ncbi:MAG: hypothetical protein RQ952_04970 [Thermoproteota archaeon]|jgi:hypothetical protein|nr:hypothetical protein [Thermoproteota archaeon]